MRKWLLGIALALSVSACATQQDQQSNINAAQLTNTAVLKMVGVAANAGKITQQDGYNLVKQIDTAQEGIDLANKLPDAQSADKIALSRSVLKSVRDYLVLKGVK